MHYAATIDTELETFAYWAERDLKRLLSGETGDDPRDSWSRVIYASDTLLTLGANRLSRTCITVEITSLEQFMGVQVLGGDKPPTVETCFTILRSWLHQRWGPVLRRADADDPPPPAVAAEPPAALPSELAPVGDQAGDIYEAMPQPEDGKWTGKHWKTLFSFLSERGIDNFNLQKIADITGRKYTYVKKLSHKYQNGELD